MKLDNKYLGLKVNVFILREIYRVMGNRRWHGFIENRGEKKCKYRPLSEILNINSSKIDRITGKGKSFLNNDEIEQIACMFNIDIKYFKKENSPIIQFGSISQDEWRIYFDLKRNVEFKLERKDYNKTMFNENDSPVINKIKIAIEKVIDDCINNNNVISDAEPVFRIIYFYHCGKAYGNEATIQRIEDVINRLNDISLEEWRIYKEQKKLLRAYEVIGNQYELLKSIKFIEEFEKK